MELNEPSYIGNELELFQHAHHWKKYYGSFLKPYLKGKVLEVGAGLGGTTASLCDGTQKEWVSLEPDAQLYAQIQHKIEHRQLPSCVRAVQGYLSHIPKNESYDAILYIDVIEHIEKDAQELALAAEYLKQGGKLIVLVPAHQFLYSPFDKAIGHYRRYTTGMLRKAGPSKLELKKAFYLDSVGLMASLANKMMLRQSYPTLAQVRLWDNLMIPVSKFTDVLVFKKLGKTAIAIWEKP